MIRLRETRHERAVMTAIIGLTALLPFVAIFAHRGASVIILAMGAAAATRAEPWRKGLSQFVFRPVFSKPLTLGVFSFLLLCLWIWLSARWSPAPDAGRLWANLLFPALAGGVVVWDLLRRAPENTHRLSLVFVLCVVAGLFLLIFEMLAGAPLRNITPPRDLSPERSKDMVALGRGLTLVLFAAYPAWLIMVRQFEHAEQNIGVGRSKVLRFSAPVVLSAVIAWAALRLGVTTNAVAVIVGGVAAFAAARAPNATLHVLLWTTLLLLAAAPFASFLPVEYITASAGEAMSPAAAQQLVEWRHAGASIFSCLPLGCGPDYARALHLSGATMMGADGGEILVPIHPKNVFLQVWLELGVVGASLLAISLVGAGLALIRARLPHAVAAGAAGAIGAVLVSVLVEASLWQVWRISAIGLAGVGVALSYSFNLKEIEWVHRSIAVRGRAG